MRSLVSGGSGSGAPGPPGPAAAPLIFTINNPSTSWVLPHNLGRIPILEVVDSAGISLDAGVTHSADRMTTTITHSSATSGEVALY